VWVKTHNNDNFVRAPTLWLIDAGGLYFGGLPYAVLRGLRGLRRARRGGRADPPPQRQLRAPTTLVRVGRQGRRVWGIG
jgi:hypothetical protein